MANELNINLDEYTGTCSSEKMKKDLLAEINENSPWQRRYEEVAHQKDLLEQSENKEQATAKRAHLMSELAKIKSELNKEKDRINNLNRKDTALLTKLYNIREAFLNDGKSLAEKADDREGSKVKSAEIKFDNGKPSLEVQMSEARGFGFSIRDGKIILPSNLSDEQLLEALDFLYRRGISYEPPQKGSTFAEVFERVEAKRTADKEIHMPDLSKTTEEDWNRNTMELAYPKNEQKASEHTASAAAAAADNTIPNADEPAPHTLQNQEKKDKKEKTGFEKAFEKMDNFLKVDQQKREGLSYFIDGDANSSQVTFSVYNNEDADNPNNDGKKEKKGGYKETCAYRVRLTQKDGKLSKIEFHVPNGGKMPEGFADKAADLVKSQGALYLNCPNGLSPADAKEIRNACARAGILPKGIGINLNHATKMDDEATNNIMNKEELYAYKGKLGRHLLELCTNDKDPRIPFAQSLITQEKLYPLTTQLEGCLTNALNARIEETGDNAHKVLGAAETIKQIFTAVTNTTNKTSPENSVEKLCQTLSRGDEKLQKELLQAMQNTGAINLEAHQLNDEQMMALFNALEPTNIEKEKQELDKEIRSNHKDSKETIIERRASKASRALNTTINKVLKDKGFKNGFNTIDFGDLRYPDPAPNTNTNTLAIGGNGGAEM